MVDAKLPEDVTVTIDGVTFTTELFSFDDSSGNKNRSIIKTMNRGQKVGRPSPNDFTVALSGTPVDTGFDSRFADEDTQTIVLSWSDLTITYNNSYIDALNYKLDSEDRLVAELEFTVPYYDITGSANRVVS